MDSKRKFKPLIYNIIAFLIILFISLAVFYLLEAFLDLERPVIAIFSSLGYVDSQGITSIANTNVIIDYQCSGFFSIFVFLALMFSPITLLSFKRKVIWFFIGFILLYLANLLRLLALFELSPFIGIETMHVLGWFFMSLIILGLWYIATKNKSSKK